MMTWILIGIVSIVLLVWTKGFFVLDLLEVIVEMFDN